MQGSDLVERQRLRGFRDAVSEVGLTVPSSHILLVPYRIAPARAACQALLDVSQRPTALIIGSDLLAAGVFQVLYDHGLRVPDDLSVASYDDTLGPYMAPPLIEAEPPTEEMGRQAVDLIVEECQRSAARGHGRGQRVVLLSRLHLRDSTRPLDGPLARPREINYPFLMDQLRRWPYEGCVGLEYRPLGESRNSVLRTAQLLGGTDI